jgi:CheY-like chemotaxis protein
MPDPKSASFHSLKTFRVLAVGESQDVRAIGMNLSNNGHRVAFAANIREAQQKLKKESNLDAIVLDLKLPAKDGPTAIRKQTENGKFAGLFVIQTALSMKITVPVFLIDNLREKWSRDVPFLQDCGIRLCTKPVDRKAVTAEILAVLQDSIHPCVGAVLVVHTQPDVVELIHLVLEAKGLKVISTASPEAGLKLIEEHRPGIVIHNFNMPGINGEEFDKRIREKFGPHEPAIIWTSKTPMKPNHAQEYKISAWVKMPFEPIDFAYFVEEVLKGMVNEKTAFPKRFKMV